MKLLYIGGVKSGKSALAEARTLALCDAKPYYLATTEFIDEELALRIEQHKLQRSERFESLEEGLDLVAAVSNLDAPVLIECTTMWLNNMLYHGKSQEQIVEHIDALMALEREMVIVHNDVGSGVIPDNALARQFVDLSGIVARRIAHACDEVHYCIAGLSTRMK